MKSLIAIMLFTLFSNGAVLSSIPQEKISLELADTTITEDGKTVLEVGGKCGTGKVLAFHLPGRGWFVASAEPYPGYDFRRTGKLNGNRISFRMDDRSYEIISSQPISPGSSPRDLWIVRITPPADKADAESKLISCATDFKYWLDTTLLREVKP